jgi:eukaryotic-like serine/threonine-protein kinase
MSDIPGRLAASLADRYLIEREMGQGGMATVYRAQDVKHDRAVAIKVVRPELAAVIGADRFVREIQTIAHLQHPHILGLIDSGEVDGTAYYVMPFVEGESLRDRLQREKQLPISDALRITTEVAGALDYAHRHGVIHRDIKPENIMLHDGSALVADFGIALAASSAETRMTETGMSLGTPQYMAPEQAMGERQITAASDVYALGCVAYEMLTGDPPFSGSTAQAIVAKVVTEQPRSMIAQRHTIPRNVEQAVFTALEKLPADRFATASEFATALTDRGYTSATASGPVGPAVARSRLRDPLFVGMGVVTVAAVVGGAALAMRPGKAPAVVPPIQFVMATTDSTRPFDNFPWPAAISPDGGTVVYTVVPPSGAPSLYYLRTDQLAPRIIAGTAGAYQPYFSPDGKWLAFEMAGKERKVHLDGSAAVTIGEGNGANGACWTASNQIVLGSQGGYSGLSEMSAAGGTPAVLTRVDSAKGERNHLWPIGTPDGRAVVFTIWSGSLATAQLGIAPLQTGTVTRLGVAGIRPLAVLDGMLVYVRADGSIMAVGLDVSGEKVAGSPIPVHDPVSVLSALNGNSEIYISQGGALVSSIGGATGRLSWISHTGAVTAVSPKAGNYVAVALSPDQHRIAVLVDDDGQSDVWIDDLTLGTFSRLTTLKTVTSVAWTPDGANLLYLAAEQNGNTLYLQRASGGVPAKQLALFPVSAAGAVMAPDSRSVLVDVSPSDLWQLERLTLDSVVTTHPYLAVSGNAHAAQFSPDGKWVALTSDESGQEEVYLRSYPDPSSKLQVSAGGGASPVWSADGKRLYYVSGTSLLAARLTTTPTLTLLGRDTVVASFPTPTVGGYFTPAFQPSRDGQRFLASVPDRNDYQLVISPNWITQFRRKIAEARSGQ